MSLSLSVTLIKCHDNRKMKLELCSLEKFVVISAQTLHACFIFIIYGHDQGLQLQVVCKGCGGHVYWLCKKILLVFSWMLFK